MTNWQGKKPRLRKQKQTAENFHGGFFAQIAQVRTIKPLLKQALRYLLNIP